MRTKDKMMRIIIAIFIMVLSATVLFHKVPDTKFVQNSVISLEETQNKVMAFSGAAIGASVAISLLPNDMGAPLADTMTELSKYCVFMLAVVFIEKLIVMVGIKIALLAVIPIACALYILSILLTQETYKKLALKLAILGLAIIIVIPFSTHVTNTVCAEYLASIDKTIEQTDADTDTINEIVATDSEDTTVWEKIGSKLSGVVKGVSGVMTHFKDVVKKCVNVVAVLLVTTFVMPLVILFIFRWLLKELFALEIPTSPSQIKILKKKKMDIVETEDTVKEDTICEETEKYIEEKTKK